MVTEVERLIVRLEATQTKFEKQLAGANRSANRRARAIENRFAQMNKRVSAGASAMARSLGAVFAGAVTIRGAQQLIDASTRIENALKVAGLAGDELTKVYDRLFESAQRNAAPIESLVELYSRASLVQKELGVSTEELLAFTDQVAVALRVSGKSASEASGALLQLSQALGSGIVRAEEFNSILEGALPIAQAAAAGLEEAGGSVAKLRSLVVDGKVSSEAFFRAFEAGSVILQEKVADAELTVSQRFVRLQNVLTDAAGKFDEAGGASEAFGQVLDDLADFIEGIDFGNIFDQLDTLVAKFAAAEQAVMLWSQQLGAALGTDAIGEALSRTAIGERLGIRSYNSPAERMNMTPGDVNPALEAALADRIAGLQKSDRPTDIGTITPTVKPVSLGDYPITGGSGGGGRSGRRGGGGSRRENDYQREIAQIRERTQAIIAETQAMAGLNPLVDDYGFAVEKAHAALELEQAARKAGLEITPELRSQMDSLATSYANAAVAAEQLAEKQDMARQSAEDMRALGKDVMGGFIKDLQSGTSASEALANALQKVADKLLDVALNNIFGGLGGGIGGGRRGGLLGGFLIPGILHDGGVAGRDGYGHGRAVSPAAFRGAKRYHSGGVVGLRAGEVPAILERGEVVLPKGTKAASPQQMNISVNVEGANGDQHVIELVRQGVAQGIGQYDKQINRTFGSRMANAQGRQL